MSMTPEAQRWHLIYEGYSDGTQRGLSQFEQRRVGYAYTAARIALRADSNFVPANGDRAEELVAAITKYYRESL